MEKSALFRLSESSLNLHPDFTSTQIQVDGMVATTFDQVADGKTFLPMVTGGVVNRWAKLALLPVASRLPGPLTKISFLVRGATSFFALGAEAAAFEITHRALQSTAPSHRSSSLWSWSGPHGLKEGWLHSFVTFATLKGMGKAAEGQNLIFQHGAQALGMVAGHQLVYLAGWGEKPEGSLAEQIFHAEGVNLQMIGGMALIHAGAPGLHALERGWDLSIRARRGGTIFPPNFWERKTQVDLVLAENGRGPLKLEESPEIGGFKAFMTGPGSGTKPGRFEPSLLAETLSALFGEQPSRATLQERRLVLEQVDTLLSHMPGTEPYFLQFPEQLAIFSLAHGLVNTGKMKMPLPALNLFIYFLRYKLQVDGRPAKEALKTGRATHYIEGLFKEFFTQQYYFLPLIESSLKLAQYSERITLEASERETDRAALGIAQDLSLYLARRATHPAENWQDSVAAALKRALQEGTLSTPSRNAFEKVIDDSIREVNFLQRLIANHPDVMKNFGREVTRDFPEADSFAQGKTQTVTWEEIDRIRREHLPAGQGQGKERPTVMIVGIGQEWDIVTRYAGRGYDLILVDPLEAVAQFFKGKHAEIKSLQDEHGIRVQFVKEDIRSPDLARYYAGRADALEYHNMFELLQEDSHSIDTLLKPGGLFLQFHPFSIDRARLLGKGYQPLLHQRNIPGVLSSFSETNAYPLGNEVLILKKPPPPSASLSPAGFHTDEIVHAINEADGSVVKRLPRPVTDKPVSSLDPADAKAEYYQLLLDFLPDIVAVTHEFRERFPLGLVEYASPASREIVSSLKKDFPAKVEVAIAESGFVGASYQVHDSIARSIDLATEEWLRRGVADDSRFQRMTELTDPQRRAQYGPHAAQKRISSAMIQTVHISASFQRFIARIFSRKNQHLPTSEEMKKNL